jgi:hypothetical protein
VIVLLVGHVERILAQGNAYSGLVGKSEGKRPLGRSRPRGRMILKYVLKK